MFLIILIFSAYLTLHADGFLGFSLVTNSSSWEVRRNAELHLLRGDLLFIANQSVIPSGSFILYGGTRDSVHGTTINDVWASWDGGFNWVEISDQEGIYPGNGVGDSCTSFYSDTAYVVLENRDTSVSSIWVTRDYQKWRNILPEHVPSVVQSPFKEKTQANCLVDSFEGFYYLLGRYVSPDLQILESNIWSSIDNGQKWFLLAQNLNLPPRYTATVAVHYNNIHLDNVDVVYVLGGVTQNSSYNDLWASSDGGQSWICILEGYPWSTQNSIWGDLVVSPDGILIYNVVNLEDSPLKSEFWVSLDGGYHWGICNSEMSYGPRVGAAWVFDLQLNLYAMGGLYLESPTGYRKDVWKSEINFGNWTLVAAGCDLKIPPHGVGLTHWPGF